MAGACSTLSMMPRNIRCVCCRVVVSAVSQHFTWGRLHQSLVRFCDSFGIRLSGTQHESLIDCLKYGAESRLSHGTARHMRHSFEHIGNDFWPGPLLSVKPFALGVVPK